MIETTTTRRTTTAAKRDCHGRSFGRTMAVMVLFLYEGFWIAAIGYCEASSAPSLPSSLVVDTSNKKSRWPGRSLFSSSSEEDSMTPKPLHRRRHRNHSHARHNQHNHDPRANCGCCDDCQSLPATTTGSGWFQGIQAWMRGGGSSPKGQGRPRQPQVVSSSSASQFHQDRPVACRLYIWNFPSAILHKWCHHLAKDCIYEGKGGVKVGRTSIAFHDTMFLSRRVISLLIGIYCDSSTLLRLFYASLVCSRCTRIHVAIAVALFLLQSRCLSIVWRQLSRSFDLELVSALVQSFGSNLDQTLQQATSHLDLAQQSTRLSSDMPTLLFHRNYVRDGLEIVSRDETPCTKKARRRKNKDSTVTTGMNESAGWEWRKSHSRHGTPYAVRSLFDPSIKSPQQLPSFALTIAWHMVLGNLDHWMRIETMENLHPSKSSSRLRQKYSTS